MLYERYSTHPRFLPQLFIILFNIEIYFSKYPPFPFFPIRHRLHPSAASPHCSLRVRFRTAPTTRGHLYRGFSLIQAQGLLNLSRHWEPVDCFALKLGIPSAEYITLGNRPTLPTNFKILPSVLTKGAFMNSPSVSANPGAVLHDSSYWELPLGFFPLI